MHAQTIYCFILQDGKFFVRQVSGAAKYGTRNATKITPVVIVKEVK